MDYIVRSATEARNDFFKLINAAYYGRKKTVVEKSGRKIAMIVPIEEKLFIWDKYIKSLNKLGGSWNKLVKDKNRSKMKRAWKKRIGNYKDSK